jgi:hypothetical protein
MGGVRYIVEWIGITVIVDPFSDASGIRLSQGILRR